MNKKRNHIFHLNKTILNDIDSENILNTYVDNIINPKYNNDKNYYVDKTLSCSSGKETYATRQDAENALKQRHNSNKRSYRCVHCGHFHLTSNKNYNKHENVKRDKRIKNHKKVNDPNILLSLYILIYINLMYLQGSFL